MASGITRRSLLERAGAAAFATACGGIAACGDDGEDDLLARARERGFLRAGFANEAPFAYATGSGRLIGQAPDVARAVLARLGVPRLDGVLTAFDELIPDLLDGRFDIITAGMFITPERCRQIRFSNPDFAVKQAFAVGRGNPLGLSDYRDVAAHPSARLGVVAGAAEETFARHSGVRRVERFPDPPSGIQALLLGRIDAFALTSVSVRRLVAGRSRLEMTEPFVPVIDGRRRLGYGGYGFRRTDAGLADAFDRELRRLQRRGDVRRLVARYGFTAEEVELAERVTAAEICG